MKKPKYHFEDLDYWEKDGYLVVDGNRFYFQFSGEPSLGDALENLFLEGHIRIVEDNGWLN